MDLVELIAGQLTAPNVKSLRGARRSINSNGRLRKVERRKGNTAASTIAARARGKQARRRVPQSIFLVPTYIGEESNSLGEQVLR